MQICLKAATQILILFTRAQGWNERKILYSYVKPLKKTILKEVEQNASQKFIFQTN